MRHRFVLTAALALGGLLVLPVSAQVDPTHTGGQAADRVVDRDDRGTAVAPDAEGIRDLLAQVTEAAVTKGGFDDLVERFVDADRNRLGASGVTEQEHKDLDRVIEQFLKNWQAKYDQEFNIRDEDEVYPESFAMIVQSKIGDAQLAGERQPGMPSDAAPPDSDKIAGGDTNREPGRTIASVTILESHGLPGVTVPLIHEFPDRWKIDVPDTATAEQLRDNLTSCLTKLNEQKDEWPADVNDAYRQVTHGVLVVVLDKN